MSDFNAHDLRTFETLLVSRIRKNERGAANKTPREDGFVFDLSLNGAHQSNLKLLTKVRSKLELLEKEEA